MPADSVTTRLYPAGMLNTLSRHEVERLHDASRGDLGELVRRCSLAVLNSGNESDDAEALIRRISAIFVSRRNRSTADFDLSCSTHRVPPLLMADHRGYPRTDFFGDS